MKPSRVVIGTWKFKSTFEFESTTFFSDPNHLESLVIMTQSAYSDFFRSIDIIYDF